MTSSPRDGAAAPGPTVRHDPLPLGRGAQAWRLLVVLLISTVAWWELLQWQLQHAPLWFAADLALGVLGLLALPWRRRYPVAVATFTAVAGALSAASAGPATLALASLATRRRWREVLPLAALSLGASFVLAHLDPADPVSRGATVSVSIAVIAVTIGWGMYIGSRRELLATLRERADRAETEQAARVAQARTAERTRIAREMHDVLAHRLSLVTVHAGALAYREDLTRAQMQETAAVIEEGSRQALVELREVLGVLRDDPGDAVPEPPQPSGHDLAALVEDVRRTGLRVDSRLDLDVDALPDGAGRTLYRVVQEALTNARKHAPGARVRLAVDGSPGHGVDVEVRNQLRFGTFDRPAPESGLGLVGLAERAELVGGRLHHAVTPEREFVLSVWLPWSA